MKNEEITWWKTKKNSNFQQRNENKNKKERNQNAGGVTQTNFNVRDINGRPQNSLPTTSTAISIAQATDESKLPALSGTEPDPNSKCESEVRFNYQNWKNQTKLEPISRIPGLDLAFAEARKENPKFNEIQHKESFSPLLETLAPLPTFKPILKRALIDIGEILYDPGRNRRPERWERRAIIRSYIKFFAPIES